VKQRHRLHANPFNIRGRLLVPDWTAIYGRAAPIAIDVGFGDGRFTLELARRHPEWNVLGLEIREHLVGDLGQEAAAAGLKNLHALVANANLQLDDLLPERSVVFVAVNFPDPWYKQRHHKRRVVNAAWVRLLAPKLAPKAELHAMTDYAPVAREILTVVEADSVFVNLDGAGRFATESTTGIPTERELTHLRRGEPIYRLRFCFEPSLTTGSTTDHCLPVPASVDWTR